MLTPWRWATACTVAPGTSVSATSRRFASTDQRRRACPRKISICDKRLERGRFIWPSPADGVVAIRPAQLGYMLEGIDWRHPQRTWRPSVAG